MSTFLLLVGLAMFISGAAMYMAHAARHDPRWVAGSIFMPVVVLLYYRRHWDELWMGALVQAAGLVMERNPDSQGSKKRPMGNLVVGVWELSIAQVRHLSLYSSPNGSSGPL